MTSIFIHISSNAKLFLCWSWECCATRMSSTVFFVIFGLSWLYLIGQLLELTGNGVTDKVDDMKHMAVGQTQALGRCSKDAASEHGMCALPTEPL